MGQALDLVDGLSWRDQQLHLKCQTKNVKQKPRPTIQDFQRNQTVGDASPLLFLMNLANSLVWATFGLPMLNPDVAFFFITNCIATLLNVIYLEFYFKYSRQQGRKVVIFWVVVIGVVITAIILQVFLVDHGYPIRTLPSVMLLTSIGASVVPPLPVMNKVVQTKSVQGMPLLQPMASLLNGTIWVSYAQTGVDFVLLVPYGVMIFMSMVQMVIYGSYCPKIGCSAI